MDNVHALFSVIIVSGYACYCQGLANRSGCSPITLHIVRILYQYFQVHCLTVIKYFVFFHEEGMPILFLTTLNHLILVYSKLLSHI
jgi:phage shock protein PspC (stress-responsive transcriptional regulator)